MSERAQLLAMQLILKGALSDMTQEEQDRINNQIDRVSNILNEDKEIAAFVMGMVSCDVGLEVSP